MTYCHRHNLVDKTQAGADRRYGIRVRLPEGDTAPISETADDETPVGTAPDADVEPELEVFFTFTWGGFNKRPQGNRPPRGKGKPQRGKPPKGKRPPNDGGGGKGRNFEARPPKKDKIDPDNPFAAALMGLKDKG